MQNKYAECYLDEYISMGRRGASQGWRYSKYKCTQMVVSKYDVNNDQSMEAMSSDIKCEDLACCFQVAYEVHRSDQPSTSYMAGVSTSWRRNMMNVNV